MKNLGLKAKADSIDLLFRQSAPAVVLSLLSALLLTTVLWEEANHADLLTWLGLVAASLVIRSVIFILYFRAKPEGLKRLRWQTPFLVALFTSASVWSGGITLIATNLPIEGRLFTYFFLMGMAAGAISVFIALRFAAIITVTIMLAPMTLLFLSSGSLPQIITGIAASIAIVSTISGTKILGNSLSRIFSLTHELEEQTAKLESARASAEEAKELRGQFIASISHEIRTPLGVMLGMIELIASEKQTAKARTHIATLETAGDHLKSLIDNVLDFVKIDDGRMELFSERINLPEQAEAVKSMLAPRAAAKEIAIHLDTSELTNPFWYADRQRLRQILFNLVGNAVKYSERGEINISLRTVTGNRGVAISVADEGIGIEPSALELIFEAYSQEHGRRLDELQSTGLGLAITKQLAELMGGEIKVRSKVGVGSTFSVFLPLAQAYEFERRVTSREESSDLTRRRSDLSILIAEDMPLNRQLIASFLESSGEQLTFVNDGAAAVDAVRKRAFNLILMDLQMGPIGGLAATRQIREIEVELNRPRTPIIIQSADNRQECVDASLNAGACEFLPKPFSRTQLVRALDRALDITKREDERDGLDPSLIAFLPKFISATDELLNQINRHIARQDFEAASFDIHGLKGYCGMFQQKRLEAIAARWEKAIITEDRHTMESLQIEFNSWFNTVKANSGDE